MRLKYDRLGRQRPDGQERGLRPLHPRLPDRWVSRALRISMPGYRWQEFEALLARVRDVTRARAAGQVMAQLMDVQASSKAAKVHWLDWEHEKARRLLRIGGTAA